MTKVYWIRHNKHSDVLTEGYIGITNNLNNRLRYHKERNTNKKLRNAISKYQDEIIVDVLYEYDTEDEALQKEEELRPKEFIGWNLAPGGGKPPRIKDYPEAIDKIRESVKKLNNTPYCEKTHSKEALEKASKTKQNKSYKWYHNPETLEYKIIATSEEEIPQGWQPGMKPKKEYDKKIRGVDYECNSKTWIVINPQGDKYTVTNLKNWCNEKGLPYFATIRSGKWKGWSFSKIAN
jgi:group I intron endonuclease